MSKYNVGELTDEELLELARAIIDEIELRRMQRAGDEMI